MVSNIGVIERETCTIVLLSVMVILGTGLHFYYSLNSQLSFTHFEA